MEKINQEKINTLLTITRRQRETSLVLLLTIGTILLLIGIALTIYLTRRVTEPVNELIKAAEQVKQSNLSISPLKTVLI